MSPGTRKSPRRGEGPSRAGHVGENPEAHSEVNDENIAGRWDAQRLATWLTERGWAIVVVDARTVYAERAGQEGARRRARHYVLDETLIGRRWIIERGSVRSRSSRHDERTEK